MRKLTFKVSAKTARLFGRENASNAEAAISELVKNTYDADATCCFICLLPRYDSVPSELSESEHSYLVLRDPRVKEHYDKRENGTFKLRSRNRDLAHSIVRQLRDLWIIDDGTGMTAETIEKCWMVIGTNDKEQNVISKKGRARTGAKGIGRFALDRLGSQGTVYSTCDDGGELKSIRWFVNWSQFDKEGSILDEIPAELHEDSAKLCDVLAPLRKMSEVDDALQETSTGHWETGTAIRISLLRDDWSRQQVDQVNKALGALIPPIEQRELKLYLFDASARDAYGRIDAELLENYDYKLEASLDGTGSIQFDIFRNELNVEEIDPDIFRMEEMKKHPFDETSFRSGKVTYWRTIDELFPGRGKDFREKVRQVGPFSTQLLFYKKGRPSRRDSRIYPYRTFQPAFRKAWLDKFGGIKIYRDNFAVRPYGEVESRAFDWLALGQRVAVSPVAASRKGWKASPQNLAGTISISREANKELYDQTNREGIIESDYFGVFREIILRVIQEFEDDRSHIHHNLNKLYKEKNRSEQVKSEGAKTANRIVSQLQEATVDDAQQLAKAVVAQEEEIRELKDEQSMLRALATLGTVLVSFSHEMGQLQNSMGYRSSSLADILTSYISPDELVGVSSPFNPYEILSEWEEDDNRVKQWFTFVLASIRANRRRRRQVSLREYFDHASALWAGFLRSREIELNIEFARDDSDYQLLAFDIDLDSIFNNLILNSVEGFLSRNHHGPRLIHMNVDSVDKYLQILYSDNGPGLHPSIKDPNEIFRFGVTTKQGPGSESGTGLGMWILRAVVHGYGGTCSVLRSQKKPGFRLRTTLPGQETRGWNDG